MNNLKYYILVFSISICFSNCGGYGSIDYGFSETSVNTQKALTNLSTKISTSEDPMLIQTYNKLEKTSNELFLILEDCHKKYKLTKNYITTLQEAQKALERLHQNFASTSDKTLLLEAIYLDYHAKLQSIVSSPQNDANSTIRVTIDSSKEDGFFVFGKLSYEEKLPIKRFRFNKPTHDAFQDFVPGYYLFWLEKEDRIGTPELHLIINNGTEAEKKLVLETPK